MGTTGSVDGAGRLVIKGRFQQKQIENVLRRYMGQYLPSLLPFLYFLKISHPLPSSRIRDLQDLQIPRHSAHKRKPYLLHGVRVMW